MEKKIWGEAPPENKGLCGSITCIPKKKSELKSDPIIITVLYQPNF